jgi:microcompartment protein CcmL/EutN
MTLTREEGLEAVTEASTEYLQAKLVIERRHESLKKAIKEAKEEGRATQQEIADATVLTVDEDGEEVVVFDLSRQRISQIINE